MNASSIPAQQGTAGEIEGRPVAVYNTGEGLIVMENVCTHMGCQTAWNQADQSWDCPCHGSRYHPDGTLIKGPAAKPLPRLSHHLEGDAIAID